MYWPSTSKDAQYVFESQEGPLLDADEYLNKYDDWTDVSFWPMSSRVDELRKKGLDKQGDPLAKEGFIGAFCRTYTITEAIDKFLSEVYVPCDVSDRYTYVNGSTAAGVVIYEDKFAYSNHSTDPASMKLCNAFDLVRIHKFGELDIDQDFDSKKQLPSVKAMMDFVKSDDETDSTFIQEEIMGDFGDIVDVPAEEVEWRKKLKRHVRTHEILSTIENVEIVLANDPRVKDRFAINTFSQRPIALSNLPWRSIKDGNRDWKDSDDSALRAFLEKHYGISGRGIIEDAFINIANMKEVHPIKEYINQQVWDGVERVDTLLIDYLGANDSEYVRQVTRKTLCAAVARVFRPGIKFDTMLVLTGGQGLGKTTFFERLGGEWFSNSMPTFKGKDAMEALQGVWILEVGELAAMKKAESEEVKNLLSKTRDQFRVAYGRRQQIFPRQCIFVGTTNKKEIFRDTTGNRRFWPVDLTRDDDKKEKFFKEFNKDLVAQIWAEAKELWEGGEPLYLSYEMEEEAQRIQEEHKEVDIRVEPIRQYLDTLLPEDWEELSLSDRRDFLTDNFEGRKGVKQRDRVCVLELVQEAFNQDINKIDNYRAKEFNDIMHSLSDWEYKTTVRHYKPYKRGRGFVRIEPIDTVNKD
jgi:predicted P-loop ATPase